MPVRPSEMTGRPARAHSGTSSTLLILGGTKFLGRAIVEAALARSHAVTTFTRGETNPGLFPEVEELHGDRDGGLQPLEGRAWDAVIDTSGQVPRVVRASAELLEPSVGHYTFTSSVSVYADLAEPPTEATPVAQLDDESVEELGESYENYGGLKALCERAVQEVFGDRALIVRPGLIVGPHDPTDRFTYWARRLVRGGKILAPGPPERQVQFVDVRDLAEWMVQMAEERRSDVFNATNEGIPMSQLLEGAEVEWVNDGFLLEHGVGEWMELPLWIADPAFAGMQETNVSRAVEAGLTFRPVGETVRDTQAWDAARGTYEPAAGLAPEREAELLAAWPE